MTERQPRPSTVAVPEGYEIGSWRVERLLGSGGFGSVYTARRSTADEPRRAALKFLPTGTRTPRQLRHLQDLAEREIDVLRRVRAPRLIRMHEVLTVDDSALPDLDGATVLVLDHAETSLDHILARTARPASAETLFTQICEGLVQLHGAGWVHGDRTPAVGRWSRACRWWCRCRCRACPGRRCPGRRRSGCSPRSRHLPSRPSCRCRTS